MNPDHLQKNGPEEGRPAVGRTVTPRPGQGRASHAAGTVPAAGSAGVSADALARALQTYSRTSKNREHAMHALRNRETALRFARAKELGAQREAAARAALGVPLPSTDFVPPTGPETRFDKLCQGLWKHVRSTVLRLKRRAEDWDQRTVILAGIAAAAVLVASHEAGRWLSRGRGAGEQGSPAHQLLSSREWFQQAQARAEEGNFRRALGTVQYALASTPKNVDQLIFEGDMHQSLFQFVEAQRAYEKALRLNAGNPDARQNLVLCRRLNRYRGDAASHRSTLYGLHRVMLGQNRISEALAICRRLGNPDRTLQQATWQAALSETGMQGKVTVGMDGALEIDLSGVLAPDLSRLKEFPIVSLNLAGTGLEDIGALRGMKLKRLDLSRTLVHDLAPLRGMPLQDLRLRGTGVVELSALRDCPLLELDISETRIGDLGPLARMPLNSLRAANTPVADLRPLATVPLVWLNVARTRVNDLGALRDLGLKFLALDGTHVADLTPLQGCHLRELSLSATSVRDLSPLAGMPLLLLTLTDCAEGMDLRPLENCAELEHLHLPSRPLHLERLAGLPRLHFIQQNDTRLEDMLLLTGPTGPRESQLEDTLLTGK